MHESEINYYIKRFSSQRFSTLSIVNREGEFLCFGLEDEYREEKVYGETRIPAGKYELTLKTHGGFHNKYTKKFKDLHHGMILVNDVPDFTDVLWHIGNTDEDTHGCLLLGDSCESNIIKDGFVGSSTSAYKRVYPIVAQDILEGKSVFATYT